MFGIDTLALDDSPASRGAQLLAALDYLTQTSSVRTRVDASRLAVAGHSLGGGGAFEAALRRPSLKAAIPNAPFIPGGASNDRVPTLITAMQNDSLVTQDRSSPALLANSTINCILVAMASMRRPSFLILSALAVGPLHGYAVIKEVARLSDDTVRLGAGTLYAALDRLSDDGLVEVDREETVDGRLRRYYRLTGPGAAALAAEAEQMRRDAQMVFQRLRGAGSAGAPSPA